MFLSRSVKTQGRADIADWWGVTGARPLPHQSQSWTHFLRRIFLASHILGYNRGAVPGEVQTRNYISVQEASCPLPKGGAQVLAGRPDTMQAEGAQARRPGQWAKLA